MILYYLLRSRLAAAADSEKFRFFLGATENPLFLSRRWPLWTAVSWPRALVSPRYARSVVAWLEYRAELYDGLQG